MKNRQTLLLKKHPKAYGGILLNTRKGRSTPRPLDTKNTMHLVLRSTKAHGEWSFKKPQNEKKIREIINKFSYKYGIKIHSLANVGNHLHLHLKLNNRYTYRPFIRAITASIAMAITGISRWSSKLKTKKIRFWDYRPFTRVVQSLAGFLNLRDYILINQLEGAGFSRIQAHYILKKSNRTELLSST